jgi:hypothetical protein
LDCPFKPTFPHTYTTTTTTTTILRRTAYGGFTIQLIPYQNYLIVFNALSGAGGLVSPLLMATEHTGWLHGPYLKFDWMPWEHFIQIRPVFKLTSLHISFYPLSSLVYYPEQSSLLGGGEEPGGAFMIQLIPSQNHLIC